MDSDNLIKDQFDHSDSGQKTGDSDGGCEALSDKGREGILEGIQVKIEETNFDSAELNDRVSSTDWSTKIDCPSGVPKTSFEGELGGGVSNTALKIKQEDQDDDYDDFHEDGDVDAITGGFLGDIGVEPVGIDGHCDGELAPGYTIDINLEV